MAECDILVSHTTILRWVLHYVPEFEMRWDRYARPVNTSWRMTKQQSQFALAHQGEPRR
jgi:transposase-like protein